MPWTDTGRTETGRALNGHLMEYRVLVLRDENDRIVTEDTGGLPVAITKRCQVTAQCTPQCRACGAGESLPDW